MKSLFSASWKTTAAGLIGLIQVILVEAKHGLDDDPLTTVNLNIVVAAAWAAIGLLYARDNSVSSEKAGAK